jgi:hypothetical protein
MKIDWPGGKKFAFTFCDDTDFATVANVKPIYDFLIKLGMRTTKLVWIFKSIEEGLNEGETCEDKHYLDWLLSIQKQGFEIGMHNVSAGTSSRKSVIAGLDRFKELFGSSPKIHCNHTGCAENLYWGDARISGWRRMLYNIRSMHKGENSSQGHLSGNLLFWGDLCREKITYVRNFTFDKLNTLKQNPQMPYHDSNKPFVNYWFAATNGADPKYFKQNFTISKIDRLINEGGLCIVYIHFGARFVNDNGIDDYFKKIMEYVVSKDGWFVTVSEVLDYLRQGADPQIRRISQYELFKLELRWMCGKMDKKMGI